MNRKDLGTIFLLIGAVLFFTGITLLYLTFMFIGALLVFFN